MAAPPRSKADHRFQVFLILCLWIFIGYLYFFVGPGVFFTNLFDGSGGGDAGSAQNKTQEEYGDASDRLSKGTVNAFYPKTVQVDESFKIGLAACGSPVAVCLIDKGTNTQITKSQTLGVGAYIYAKLSSPSKDLTVNSDGNGERPVFKPAEVQQWEWSLTAARPDTYDLTIEVTTQRADSTKSLGTVMVQHITITAHDTAATWSARAARHIGDFFSSVVGALAAQFAAVVGFLVYRHNKRNPAAPAVQAPPTVQPRPTPPTIPTPARRPPPSPRQPAATMPRSGARKRR